MEAAPSRSNYTTGGLSDCSTLVAPIIGQPAVCGENVTTDVPLLFTKTANYAKKYKKCTFYGPKRSELTELCTPETSRNINVYRKTTSAKHFGINCSRAPRNNAKQRETLMKQGETSVFVSVLASAKHFSGPLKGARGVSRPRVFRLVRELPQLCHNKKNKKMPNWVLKLAQSARARRRRTPKFRCSNAKSGRRRLANQ
jgi:hypothetical protein